MKIAVLSNAYSNLPALEAVWASIQTEGADKICCLGNFVNFTPRINEVTAPTPHQATVAGFAGLKGTEKMNKKRTESYKGRLAEWPVNSL